MTEIAERHLNYSKGLLPLKTSFFFCNFVHLSGLCGKQISPTRLNCMESQSVLCKTKGV